MSIVCRRDSNAEQMQIVVQNARSGCNGKVVFASEVVTDRATGERLSSILEQVVVAPEGSGLPGQTLIVGQDGTTKYVDSFCSMRNEEDIDSEEDILPGEVIFAIIEDVEETE